MSKMTVQPAPVQVETAGVVLEGDLAVPERGDGVVIFAHGSGSSRRSSRNRQVAAELNRAGLATLLFDLLTAAEESIDIRTRALRFDIPLLAGRVVGAIEWVAKQPELQERKIGLFGASTGAAAALIAAAQRPTAVAAVVSRGGRPDLAGVWLTKVHAPTLLIVGGNDEAVIEMNRDAAAQLSSLQRLEIVPGATHLFEEPGKLEEVARLAIDWFSQCFANAQPAAGTGRADSHT